MSISPGRIRNIIFDWSGTLCDDFVISHRCTNITLKHFGGPTVSREKYRAEFTLPVSKFYRRYIARFSLKELDRFYFDTFEREAHRAQLFPGVKSALKLARGQRQRVFLFSTVRESLLRMLCRKKGVERFFEVIQGSVVDKEKGLPTFLRRHSLVPRETIFIADMTHEIAAARGAGCPSGMMLCGYGREEDLLKWAPDFVWNDHGGLVKFLVSLQTPSPLGERAEQAGKLGPLGPRQTARCSLTREAQQSLLRGRVALRPIPTVGALIFNRGRIFLVQTHKWGHTFGIPGGKIEKGETMEEALRREIREETGLKIGQIRFAMVQDCIDSPEFYRKGEHFLLLNFFASSRSRRFRLSDEAESGFWIDPRSALKLRLNRPTRVLIEHYLASG